MDGSSDVSSTSEKESSAEKNDKNEEKTADFPRSLKDPVYRKNFLHSIWIAGALFILGIKRSQAGLTLPDLQIITDTSVEEASVYFTVANLGEILGSLLSGFTSKRINRSLFMFVSLTGMGVCTVLVPYCKNYIVMIGMQLLAAAFLGMTDTTGNAEQMRIWGDEGHVLMQMLYFSYAVGGIVCPLFTEPFLAEIQHNEQEWNSSKFLKLHSLSDNSTQMRKLSPHKGLETNVSYISNVTESSTTTDVHFAYLITGMLCAVCSAPFLYLYLRDISSKSKTKRHKSDATALRKRHLPTTVRLCILVGMFLFFLMFMSADEMFVSYMTTYILREFPGTTKSHAAFVVGVAWASYAVCSFLMLFISRFLSPAKILGGSLCILVVTYICFILASHFGDLTSFTVFVAINAFGISPVFPVAISWADADLILVTGPVSSVIFIGSAIGPMVSPLFLGYLIEEVSNIWLCYVLLMFSIGFTLVFSILQIFNSVYVNKRFGLLSSRTVEKTIDIEFTVNEDKRNGECHCGNGNIQHQKEKEVTAQQLCTIREKQTISTETNDTDVMETEAFLSEKNCKVHGATC